MRLIVLIGIFVASTFAWQPRISPPANQLERIATGTDLYLVCQVNEKEAGGENVELLWYKNGEQMTKQKIRKNGYIQASLAFVKPTIAETGNYTCKATVGDETKEERVPIIFYERAGFVDLESTIHPQEGEDAKISCETKGDRLDEIFWLKNGYQLSEADERGYQFDDDYRTLIIPRFFGEDDDGNYSCNVVQFAQIYTKDITVTAYARPVITVFEVPKNNSGFEGSTAVFKCSATGKPSPSYKWFKVEDDGENELLTASDKYRIDDGLLGINYLVESDAGDYICLAGNEVGNSTQTAQLNILRKPKIIRMDDVTTSLGDTVKLVCTISSDSNITDAYFMFNKQRYSPASQGSSLTYETVTDEPEIEVTTDASEEEEENSTAQESIEQVDVEADEEDNTNDDNAEVDNQLRKRRSIPDESISVEWKDENLILTIENAQMTHMGRYSCYAQNVAGTTYDSAKILVTHAPVFTNVSERIIRRQSGDNAFLYCEVSAVPDATLTFERGNSEVRPDGVNVQLEKLDDKLSLSFSSLQETDFGTYKCNAKNSEGFAEPAVFEIVQILPPKDADSIVCNRNFYPNYAICQVDGYSNDSRGEWPTRFHVLYTDSDPDSDFDWETDALESEVPFFDGETIRFDGLTHSKHYFARFRAINEAGEGEFSDVVTFETTAPWTPEAVADAVIDCPDVCSVNWTTPNDRGAEITGYKLIFKETSPVQIEDETTTVSESSVSGEVNIDEEDDSDDDNSDNTNGGGDEITINVGADDHHVDLPQLLPLRNYQLTIYAINEVGLSDPTTYYFRTTENSGLATLFPLPNWAVIVLFIIIGLFLALSLDAFCCKTRHCGVLACVSSHFRNRRNRTPKDIEQGNATGESRVLITTTEKSIIRNDH